jgi:hypothetical protein
MTRPTPRRELWKTEYVEMGRDRSLQQLIDDAPRIARERGWDRAPSPRILSKWFVDYGWDDHATRYDAEAARQAWYERLCERAELQKAREELTLENTGMMYAMAASALIEEIPVPNEHGNQRFTVNKDGSLTPVVYRRPVPADKLPVQTGKVVRALLRTAVKTDQALLAGADDRYQASIAPVETAPAVTYLGRESVRDITTRVDRLIRKLKAESKRRDAESRADADGGRDVH